MKDKMRPLLQRISCNLLAFTLLTGMLLGQQMMEGSITYISRDQAYIDLGKKSGVSIGDSVQILRDENVLGIGIVTQTSGASSAMEALSPRTIAWDIGDDIQVIVNLPPPSQSTAKILSPVGSKPVPVVFLDSSAHQPRKPSNMRMDSEHLSPTFSGYISTRISDRGGDSSGVRESRGSIYGQFKVMDIGVRHLDLSSYLRSNRSSRDSSSQTSIYSIMLSYDDPGSRMSYIMGRMYHPHFSILGTLDGLGLTWRSDKRVLALAAGAMSNISGIQNPVKRNKFGLLDEERYNWGNVQVGVIGELESGSFSRNYILLGSTAKLSSRLRMRGYSEFDLDLQDQSQFQNTISLTRFRASINWRPWRSVISTSRYSYRENVVDLLDTAQTEFEKAARHSFNTNLSLMMGTGLSITGQVSFRGDDSDRQIRILGGSLSHRRFSSQALSLNLGGMAMFSYLSEGGRVYASIGKELLPWLDIDLYDEVFLYRILGESNFRTRHLPEVSFSAKVPGLQRLRLRTRFEQEGGETLYRISLSASRQL